MGPQELDWSDPAGVDADEEATFWVLGTFSGKAGSDLSVNQYLPLVVWLVLSLAQLARSAALLAQLVALLG